MATFSVTLCVDLTVPPPPIVPAAVGYYLFLVLRAEGEAQVRDFLPALVDDGVILWERSSISPREDPDRLVGDDQLEGEASSDVRVLWPANLDGRIWFDSWVG